jgi:hypothetical protein
LVLATLTMTASACFPNISSASRESGFTFRSCFAHPFVVFLANEPNVRREVNKFLMSQNDDSSAPIGSQIMSLHCPARSSSHPSYQAVGGSDVRCFQRTFEILKFFFMMNLRPSIACSIVQRSQGRQAPKNPGYYVIRCLMLPGIYCRFSFL